MITVAIYVNGVPIYTRTAVNIGEQYRTKQKSMCKYKLDDGKIIHHKQEDGAVKLAKKMLSTIKEPRSKRNEDIAWKKLALP